MLITLFQLMWYLNLAGALTIACVLWLWQRIRKGRFNQSRWIAHTVNIVLAVWIGISTIGSYLSLIPAEETFTYVGGMPPVSEKFTERFDTPFHYVYVQNGYLDHEGQRFYLNLFRMAFAHLKFEPQAGTTHIYRTAHEDRIVGRNSQVESYDNMVIAAYDYAGSPLQYDTSYTVLTTYEQFPDASDKLRAGDVITAYDGIPMTGRGPLDQYLRKQKAEKLTLDIVRDGQSMNVKLKLYDPYGYGGYHTLGFAVAENKRYEWPEDALAFPEEAKHSGSSSGLMMALQLYAHLTEPELGQGLKIAGTGGINAEAEVTTIGSLYHKVATVAARGADVFLVPRSQETEALRYQQEIGDASVRIIGVSTLAEAVEAISTYKK